MLSPCGIAYRTSQPVSQASHHQQHQHHQGLSRSEADQQFRRASAEPSGAGIQQLMEAWDVLPGLPQLHGRAASARMGTHDHHQPHYQGAQAKEGGSVCASQPGRRKPEPRGPSGKSRLGGQDLTPKERFGDFTVRRDRRRERGGWEETKGWPRGCPATREAAAPASRLARPQKPRRAAPGRRAGDVALRLRLRPARDSGRKWPRAGPSAASAARPSRPSRAPPLTAPRCSLVFSGVSSPALAQAPGPLRGPPHSRAPGALGAKPSARPPRHRCRWAPRPGTRRCSLRRRYCERGRRGRVGCGRTRGRAGRDAAGAEAQPEGGGNHNVTRARGGKDGEEEKGDPLPLLDPDLRPAPLSPPPPPSPGNGSLRVALGLPFHPGPDSTEHSPARPLGL